MFRAGKLAQEVTDITALWQDDLVTFALGCSFFRRSPAGRRPEVRNVTEGVNVPRTAPRSIATAPARLPADGGQHAAVQGGGRDSRDPDLHPVSGGSRRSGAPGDPGLIGIDNLAHPDYGDAVSVGESELPLFWACGSHPR